MKTSGVLRLLVLAATAATAFAQDAVVAEGRNLAVAADAAAAVVQTVHSAHVSRVLHKKKHVETEAPAPAEEEDEEEEETETETETETPAPAPTKKKHHKKEVAEEASPEPAPAPAPTTTAPPAPAPAPTTTAPPPAPTPEPEVETPEPTKKKKHHKTEAPAPAVEEETPSPTSEGVNDKRIKGYNNTGVIDGSSEGTAEIDKIDLRNADEWVSVYSDPPLLVIKASLYAFIAYNDSRVCDSFNMTLNAVEQKPDGNGTFSYHVVTYINCTKDSVDETPGRFVLNFIPEGKRLLLTECGHREAGEIVNWLKIKEEVPECMTPHERKSFLAQPMKHVHASNGSTSDVAPLQTNFLARLEELDAREVAIAGSATVALIAVIVVIAVFVMRKRKAQRDLERTIAGAKAEHADDEDDKSEKDEDADEKKEKKKTGDEEGSFVNSPAVKV